MTLLRSFEYPAGRRPLRLADLARLAGLAALIGAPLQAAQAADLEVTLEGVEARGGTLYISVQSEEQFMQDTGEAGEMVDDPSEGEHVFTFDVPAGTYAVSVWHDYNANGEFDREENGMPVDGWAMSGDELTGPPAFDDVSVEVTDDGADVTLALEYGG